MPDDNEDLSFTCTRCCFYSHSWRRADEHEYETDHMVISDRVRI